VRGSVWHINCCNPDDNFDNSGWTIFNGIFGWTNSATSASLGSLHLLFVSAETETSHSLVGSVLSYVFYWIAVIITLIYLKFKEVGAPRAFKASTVAADRYVT